MNWKKRMLALALALMLMSLSAFAETPVEGGEAEIVEELGEVALEDVAVAAPEAEPAEAAEPAPEPATPAEPEPMTAAPSEEPPAAAEEPPAADAVAEAPEAQAVAAPAAFPAALTLGVKERASLDGGLLSGGQPVSYVSEKPKVARVDESGLVVARKKGKTVVTVYQGETALGACEVTVLNAPKKVYLPEKSLIISKDDALAFPASLAKGYAGAITYATDNPAVLTVDAAGTLRGVAAGTATLTATAYNGKKAKCAVRVLGGPAPTWVRLNLSETMLFVKDKLPLSAAFDEGHDTILTYTTSNKKIAAVSADGVITAKKAGQATITVTTHNGLTAACAVTVVIHPKKVTLNAKKLTMHVNDGYQLIATITKNSVSEITWSSDNPGVAAVDQNGAVAAISAGKANITATASNGKKATCKITVKDPEPAPGSGDLIFEQNTPTLNVRIVNDKGVILTYIWVKDANKQLFKHYGNAKPADIMQDAVNRNGLSDKLVIAFNASPPVSNDYDAVWHMIAIYSYREPSPLMIANGQVLVNDPDKLNADKFYYWLDAGNTLRHTDRTMAEYTAEERRALYQQIIDSGARNTIIWRPVLIVDGKATTLTKEFLTKTAGNQRKQALCQFDSHNFLLVSSSSSGMMDYPHFQRYLVSLGVKTAVEFDAGGSTTTLVKPKGATAMQKVAGGGRTLSMMMYFTEG